jgi:hypothetical protein
MKNYLLKIAGSLFILMLMVACSSDDNADGANNPVTGHAIEYKLTTSAPTIISIHYKNAEGNVILVPGSYTGMTSWSKTINIPEDKPFTAAFSFEAESPAGSSPTQYTMQILVDGELKQSKTEEVTGSSNRDISFELQ